MLDSYKYLTHEKIHYSISLIIFFTINFLLLSNFLSSIYFFLFVLLYCVFFCKKNKWYLLGLLPAIGNCFYSKQLPKYFFCYYEITNYYKNNLYGIHLVGDNKLPHHKKDFLLKTKREKKYFVRYYSGMYVIKDNFLVEKINLREEYKKPSIRQIFFEKITREKLSLEDILMAIILGIKNVDKGELFKTTGTWHLLCVGGLHMNVVKSTLEFIFRCISEFFKNIRILWKLYTFLQIVILFFYGCLSSLHIPAIRSLGMNCLQTLFYIKSTSIPSIVSFYVTLLFLLIYNPDYIFNLGFQMSFLCVYLLITFVSFMKKVLKKYFTSYSLYIINSLFMNLSISIILLPFSFCFHGYYNILSPICNLLTIPIFSLSLIFTFLGLIYAKFWYGSHILFQIIIKILSYCDKPILKIYFKIKKSHINYYTYGIFLLLIFLTLLKYYLLIKKIKEQNAITEEITYISEEENIF
jgi:ComEC/Rec2-related protein